MVNSGMSIDFRSVLDFFHEAIGKVMVLIGLFLLISSVALFSKAWQYSSIASLVFGVFLIVVGIVVNYESPTLKVPSREGWGTILVCASAVFFATAVGFFLFAVPGSVWAMPAVWGRRGVGQVILLMDLARPSAWLAPIFIWGGVGLFVLGVLLKFSREYLE